MEPRSRGGTSADLDKKPAVGQSSNPGSQATPRNSRKFSLCCAVCHLPHLSVAVIAAFVMFSSRHFVLPAHSYHSQYHHIILATRATPQITGVILWTAGATIGGACTPRPHRVGVQYRCYHNGNRQCCSVALVSGLPLPGHRQLLVSMRMELIHFSRRSN